MDIILTLSLSDKIFKYIWNLNKNQFLIDTIWAIVGRYIKKKIQSISFFTSIVHPIFKRENYNQCISGKGRSNKKNFKLSPKPISNPSRYVIQFYFLSIFLFISLDVKSFFLDQKQFYVNGALHKSFNNILWILKQYGIQEGLWLWDDYY